MSTPFLGSLMSCSWAYQTKNFAFCNGQILPINQNQALFSLLGTLFGGDGRTTFGLPNLQGRTPLGAGAGFVIGQSGGAVSHTLTTGEMPTHNHTLSGNGATGNLQKPFGNSPAVAPAAVQMYGPAQNLAIMNPAVVGMFGGSQAHENRQPFLVIDWVIALSGIFPSQNWRIVMDPFVGQLLLVPYNFAPLGWALCQGQLLQLRSNTALFSLLGTYYGGDGVSTFGLPNMQGRVAMGFGNGQGLTPRNIGEQGGSPNVTLLLSEMPQHMHSANACSVSPNQATPISFALGESPNIFAAGTPNAGMAPGAIGMNGGSNPHNNMMPYQTLNWCIALQGVFPQRP